METPPESRVIFESEVPLEFKGDVLIVKFVMTDQYDHVSFDLNNKKGDIPAISLYGDFCGIRSYLSHIEILPEEFRGNRLGSLLMNALEDQLTRQGVRYSFATFRAVGTLRFLIRQGYHFLETEEFTPEISSESACSPEDTVKAKNNLESVKDSSTYRGLVLLVKELSR